MDFIDLKCKNLSNTAVKESNENYGWAPIANIVLHEDKDTFKKVLNHMQLK